MKKFNLLLMSLMALLMTCFTACENQYEVDHTAELVGTWTCIRANYAEALVFNADGTVLSTGVEDGEYWENVAGTYVIKGNVVTMNFEDDDNVKGHIDVVPGIAFTIYEEDGENWTFNYCKEDLSDEILGMWVCNDFTTDGDANMMIETFYDNGKSTLTGFLPTGDNNEQILNGATDYKVVGDLLIITIPAEKNDGKSPLYVADKLIYTPDGTAYGDILTMKTFPQVDGEYVEATSSWLRIKQTLDLPGNKYDYIKTFVTNVKGEDKDIPFLNTSFNFAKMDGAIIDKFLKSILFTVEFPEANKIKYSYLLEGQNIVIEAPILVEGNKMTVKMSAINPAYLDVDMYAFQDQDNTQMHWYMHTTSFEKFFANTSVALMLGYGQLDKNDTEAIANVYKTIADAVHSINLSLVMTKTAK
ncbi:MAG: hypothetical protein II267_02930 [Paludibacteraceae bacterium]|nr:hypothetical protein [Paludibacteraceae bacterium]